MGKDVPREMRNHLAGEAYALRERSGEEMRLPNKSNMVEVPNKFTYAGGTAVNVDQRKVEMCFRNILQLGGKNESLSLDADTPGFKETFPHMPRSFDDVEQRLFSQSSWGGNGANLMRDAVIEALALPETVRNMHFNIVTTGRNSFTDSVLALQERHPELIAVQEMPGINPRDGYIIDHEIIHEGNRNDSLILSSQAPPAERIARELEGQRRIFHADLFIATEDFGEWTDARMGLVPTSATLENTILRPGQLLLVNDGELMRILQNIHHRLSGLRFPDVIQGGEQDMHDANQVLRYLFHRIAESTPTKDATRLASIGKRAGHNASLFQYGAEAIALETSKHNYETNDHIIAAAQSEKIGRYIQGGAGRGDAAAAAVLFDDVPLEVSLSLCKDAGFEVPYDLTPEQRRLAKMLIADFAGRTNSTLVHFSMESNFAFVSPEHYRNILVRFSILPALRCVQQMRSSLQNEPQHAQCPETGIKAAAWTVTLERSRMAA